MELLSFVYTKKDNTVSTRELVVTKSPCTNYEGVDISELPLEDTENFASEYNIIHNEYIQKLTKLRDKYDLNHSFRTFIPENMSNIQKDYI